MYVYIMIPEDSLTNKQKYEPRNSSILNFLHNVYIIKNRLFE